MCEYCENMQKPNKHLIDDLDGNFVTVGYSQCGFVLKLFTNKMMSMSLPISCCPVCKRDLKSHKEVQG